MGRTGFNRTILAIAVPAFAALISEPLMLAADTAIVGRLGRAELAALGASSTVLSGLIGLCIFLAYGSTALVSRQQGAGKPSAAMSSAMGAIWLAAGLGTALAGLVYLVSGPVAGIFSSSDLVHELAQSYLKVAALSIPAALIVMATTGALRGVLDLRTPLIVMISANVVNVGATLALVFTFNLGLPGAAWGLVLAQWSAAFWLLGVVARRAAHVGITTWPNLRAVLAAAIDGFALIIRTATLRAVFLIATWLASNLGDASLAAHQIAMTVVMVTAFALDAIAIAGQTLTGHALGAGEFTRTRTITARLITWGWASGLLLGGIIGFGSIAIPSIFSSDPAIQSQATPALIVIAIAMPISGVVYVLDGVLIGAGDGRFLAWAGVFTLVAYIPLALLVSVTGAGFVSIWIAYAAFMLARFVTLWLRQRTDDWLVLGAHSR
ncbi:MAG: MATE family efflux transporter [Actinomycetales bacterium]|nr:MATE family efflux transporter [Actinomycetales bacterium]